MSTKIICQIPDVVFRLLGPDPSATVRDMLAFAIQHRLDCGDTSGEVISQAVTLSTEHFEWCKHIGMLNKTHTGRVVGQLLYAVHKDVRPWVKRRGGVPSLCIDGLRSGQSSCLQSAAPQLADGKLIFCEVGTGGGKSRVIAHAASFALSLRDSGAVVAPRPVPAPAVENFPTNFAIKAQALRESRMRESGTPPRAVIVAAPSIENVMHLVKEWRSVAPMLDDQGLIKTSVVLGRSQFVSESRLNLLLDSLDEDVPEITNWLRSGMRIHYTETTKAFGAEIPWACGLMADLEHIAANTPIRALDAALDEDSHEGEDAVYQRLREEAMSSSDLVFTTTSMLCLDSMMLANEESQPLLPYPVALFVDEAHTLEAVQASMCGQTLSLSRLLAELKSSAWIELRKQTAASSAIKAVINVLNCLPNVSNRTSLPIQTCANPAAMSDWGRGQSKFAELTAALTDIVTKLPAKAKQGELNRSIRYVKQALLALKSIQAGARGHVDRGAKGNLTFIVGPSSVKNYLVARWETTPMAMLLSGTLSHLTSSGPSFVGMRSTLGIPADREGFTDPIHPSWIYSTPTIYTPSPSVFHHYVPPSGTSPDPDAIGPWQTWCAKATAKAAEDAKGGMLILMTSYERIEGLQKALLERYPYLADRLIVQARDQRMDLYSNEFRKAARAGLRPIWIATGPAWTGLDLSDTRHSDLMAANDFLLTDLVIPNIPFGLEKSASHVASVSRAGFGVEMVAVQRRFRQGLGRLVRREGLTDRRIWLLDGRLQHPSAKNYIGDIQRVLSQFLHRKTFDFGAVNRHEA